jgi:hypothetical protein
MPTELDAAGQRGAAAGEEDAGLGVAPTLSASISLVLTTSKGVVKAAAKPPEKEPTRAAW